MGVALGVDCLVVSVGIGCSRPRPRTVATVAGSFGLFQFAMSLGGMYGGSTLSSFARSSLALAAPFLVAAVGVLMIVKGLRCAQPTLRLLGLVAVLGASLSVSVDALAAGVALGLVQDPSVGAAAVVGAASVVMSLAGFAGSAVLAERTGFAEDLGGALLILLAVLMFLANR